MSNFERIMSGGITTSEILQTICGIILIGGGLWLWRKCVKDLGEKPEPITSIGQKIIDALPGEWHDDFEFKWKDEFPWKLSVYDSRNVWVHKKSGPWGDCFKLNATESIIIWGYFERKRQDAEHEHQRRTVKELFPEL